MALPEMFTNEVIYLSVLLLLELTTDSKMKHNKKKKIFDFSLKIAGKTWDSESKQLNKTFKKDFVVLTHFNV